MKGILKTKGLLLFLVAVIATCYSCNSAKTSENKGDHANAKPVEQLSSTLAARTQFADVNGRKIAYRRFGQGQPMILCNRFRGILDSWDPLFLDSLSNHFELITFDYSGIGRSTLRNAADSLSESQDVLDLINHFKLDKIVLLGWSHGGKVAQTFAAYHPEKISYLVLLGTGPLGKNSLPPEQLFFDRALKPVNDFDDEVILFFEPASAKSVEAAQQTHDRIAQRTEDKDIDVPPALFQKYFNSLAVFNKDEEARNKLATSDFPILVISGDHDIVLPVENWYALNRKYKNMFIVTFPSSGHGPHHQHPQLAVDNIVSFVNHTTKNN